MVAKRSRVLGPSVVVKANWLQETLTQNNQKRVCLYVFNMLFLGYENHDLLLRKVFSLKYEFYKFWYNVENKSVEARMEDALGRP